MDIDSIQDAEIERMRHALRRMEHGNKRKSAKGSFSVKKKLRVAPITKRMRSTGVTPRTAKKSDTRTSRSRQMQPRKLTFGSGTNSRSASRPRKMIIDTPLQRSVQYTQSRKVRHKNARTVLKKMPRGGKPYAKRRMTSKKPKGAYRGAVMPKWAKGETKHILANDNCSTSIAASAGGLGTIAVNGTAGITSRDDSTTGEKPMNVGDLQAWCLNPIEQGTDQYQRNGRSVDGTYVRVQGHIRNAHDNSKAYVRMLLLAVKGGVSGTASDTRMGAPFVSTQLFKRIDGTVAPFTVPTSGYVSGTSGAITPTGQGSALVRTLQLPVNKSLYTVLADQKMQLADTGESFGSSDRLFDLKVPLKQRTSFGGPKCDSFEKNQLVFVVMTVDPLCSDLAPSSAPSAGAIKIEFESKYSYKDF